MKLRDFIDDYEEEIKEGRQELAELPEGTPDYVRLSIKKRIDTFIDWIFYIENYEEK